jgi:cation:H+ antiporter
MFVTGLAVEVQARRREAGDVMPVDTKVIGADMRTFVITYGLAIAAAAVLPAEPTWPKLLVAIALIVVYAWYVKGHFEADTTVDAGDLAPLRFHVFDGRRTVAPDGAPRLRVVSFQVLVALGLIILGAVEFVDAVGNLAHSIGVSEVLLALVIAPIATELPEKFNSIIWIRQGKDTLAMGNITGAMVFQSAIPTSVALVFAPETWVAGPGSYIAFTSAVIAFLASAAIFLPMARSGRLRGRGLLVGGAFYVAYLVIVVVGVTA